MEKKYQFLSRYFQFLEVKFSIYLNRRVFVMIGPPWVQRSLEMVKSVDPRLLVIATSSGFNCLSGIVVSFYGVTCD